MNARNVSRRWSGPPLALQITGLLLAGLVVAQLVTLALTMLLPPEPRRQYELGDIARVLSGSALEIRGARPLQRLLQSEPPAPTGPGWLTSERSRHELAQLLGRPEADVRLYFFTPLPFAGTASAMPREEKTGAAPLPAYPGSRHALANGYSAQPGLMRAEFLRVQAGRPGGPPGGAGPGGPGGMPGGGFGWPGGSPAPGQGTALPPSSGSDPSSRTPSTSSPSAPGAPTAGTAPPPGAGPVESPAQGQAQGAAAPGPQGQGGAPAASTSPTSPPAGGAPSSAGAPPAPGGAVSPSNQRAAQPPLQQAVPIPAPAARTNPGTASSAPSAARPPEPAAELPVAGSPAQAGSATAPRLPAPPATASPAGEAAPARGLFGLAPAPFVEGDFMAAMRSVDGWAVVQPVPEPFPNAWQRRVLLWFLVAAAVVAPAGWWFSRRLVRPISGFASAAERLGRDPSAPVLALGGPAEVGRAAHAFNRMQSRLRSFVADRTAMIGAISHDLRTPLTRMRFRIEDVPDGVRQGMEADLDEMEQMISSVLAFIRDASEPGVREKLELSSLVEDVVEDAAFVGKKAVLQHSEQAAVEIDAIGIRRLLANLVENAVKYGEQAEVRLFTERQDAVVEISDHGPGLSDAELERVFEPFYRTPEARASSKTGSGLGLAVCRSIARAHGGDVQLRRAPQGLVAQVRLPLAFDVARA
ncbi:signal transduction histidine kinase [Polaromonas sp. CF318]|uniref:ATP-binding protein n=1 Tax=Polaromonas sp. CF318 TaxID=1144318 RepID=UPI0002711F96|nr:ATP-binding protein [Polaromonas sp. CF318]EJL77861.1 signal transduction histidine kinase [Polaromonas sp. CF318]